ncbi:MAG: sigma 54-interacting transcriptional regulator [Myxococcota bacterium]
MTSTLDVKTAGLPVRTLSVEVVAGPDQGRSFTSKTDRLTVGSASDNDVELSDPTVSRYHLELCCRGDRVMVRDLGSTNGTAMGQVRLERASVTPGTVVQLGHTSLKIGEGGTASLELIEGDSLGELKGRTPAMRHLMARVRKASRADAPVLLVGESGTGKELIAKALHEQGPRSGRPFITVDCGSLAPGVVASELFGHEKGAFTGADRRHAGAFERAHSGTVFLDEIGELPGALQAVLLGVLERRRFRRVGGTDELSVDVRVVSATHRDLRAEVNAGSFRLDLYYRLAVVKIEVPALRERTDDIPTLVEHFLREAGHDGEVAAVVSKDAMDQLRAHHWPGNVRELRNVVESVLAMGGPPELEQDTPVRKAGSSPATELTYRQARAAVLQDFESSFLRQLMKRAKGNVSHAARLARMDRSHLIELLARHGLK